MKTIDLTPLPDCPEKGDTPRNIIEAVLRTGPPPTHQSAGGIDYEEMTRRMDVIKQLKKQTGKKLVLENFDHATLEKAAKTFRWPYTSENVLHAIDAITNAVASDPAPPAAGEKAPAKPKAKAK